MNCRQCTSLLSNWVDDRVPPDQRAKIDAHIRDCAACAAELQTMRRISTALTGDDGAPPPQLAERLTRAALAAGRDEEPGFLDRWIGIAWPSAAATAAAAAVLAIAMASGDSRVGLDDASGDDPVAMVTDDGELDVAAAVLGMEVE